MWSGNWAEKKYQNIMKKHHIPNSILGSLNKVVGVMKNAMNKRFSWIEANFDTIQLFVITFHHQIRLKLCSSKWNDVWYVRMKVFYGHLDRYIYDIETVYLHCSSRHSLFNLVNGWNCLKWPRPLVLTLFQKLIASEWSPYNLKLSFDIFWSIKEKKTLFILLALV